ncbi:DUF177 domain-containing protein [Actinomyces slackii]|uniref:Uncharacterized ACR, COG1399 n=1 Tax=Actinomyces slackii TaxID=52774 RepID=A0A3S4WKJ8_9ACTO|nr:DUF177 domain-containing protein [Actinomyces slackii]VEG74918.1 Uncharacterized ACR, COG1399 [Actinomyces slackii]
MPGLVIDIADLPRATGSVKTLEITAPAPADLGAGVIGVPEGSDLGIAVTLTSMDDGVLAQASADLHIHGECVRCLRDLDEDRTVRIDELYFLPEAVKAQQDEGDEEAEELYVLGETTLDLEPALRDALVPTLPFRPLCRPDCPGLCSQCGERMEDLEEGHHHEDLDPRWSALAALASPDPDDEEA